MISIPDILTQAFANLLSGLVTNIIWIIILVWGIKIISRKLGDFTRNIPSYLEQYDKIKMKHYIIDKAITK